MPSPHTHDTTLLHASSMLQVLLWPCMVPSPALSLISALVCLTGEVQCAGAVSRRQRTDRAHARHPHRLAGPGPPEVPPAAGDALPHSGHHRQVPAGQCCTHTLPHSGHHRQVPAGQCCTHTRCLTVAITDRFLQVNTAHTHTHCLTVAITDRFLQVSAAAHHFS